MLITSNHQHPQKPCHHQFHQILQIDIITLLHFSLVICNF
jgi:hypothetical protein